MANSCVLPTLMVAMVSIWVMGASDDKTNDPAPEMLFHEPFAKELSADWSWVREDRDSWEVNDGKLVVRPLNGSLWKGDNTAKNLLLRPLPHRGSVAVEVTISDLSRDAEQPRLYEQAGLLWYVDDDHYIKLVREWYDGRWHIVFAREEAGRAEYQEAGCHGGPIRLRLVIRRDQVTGMFEDAEKKWHSLNEYTLPAGADATIGLNAHTGDMAAELGERRTAFDDFVMMQLK